MYVQIVLVYRESHVKWRSGRGDASEHGDDSVTGRRFDPDRRDRIIDATLLTISQHGVAGTSHRKIALAADVPLGSMTYHFASMDELLTEAFSRFSEQVVARFRARLDAAADLDQAVEAVVALIHIDVLANQHDLILTHEFYTLAARVPSYRHLTRAWMAGSRAALERHFSPNLSRQIDALIEGVTIHAALDTERLDAATTRQALRRLCGLPD